MQCTPCRDFLQRLSYFLDEDAAARIPKWCQEHLEHCPSCACVLRTTRKTIEMYRHNDPPPIPPEIRKRIWSAVFGALRDCRDQGRSTSAGLSPLANPPKRNGRGL
jgi:hypothetical protein